MSAQDRSAARSHERPAGTPVWISGSGLFAKRPVYHLWLAPHRAACGIDLRPLTALSLRNAEKFATPCSRCLRRAE